MRAEEGASSFSCSEVYCGLYPESEPEVKAVASFLRRNINRIKAYISMHSYSQHIVIPYSYNRSKTKDHEELSLVASEAVRAIAKTKDSQWRSPTGRQRDSCGRRSSFASASAQQLLVQSKRDWFPF
ncbi:Carboxypeptidase B2 [Saguinus oedipus]|uniref:Carboxypeptidase B2 n=1 Tax=Saguinus oedipus TaxID=9490 RepID=A0ABQ9VTV1_SAGOE|nr:Carboxypeptidase B2 [Saguinus oedipus]